MTLLLLSLVPQASAFCGAYVGAPGESLNNYSSAVVMAREGTSTTLTLISDYEGDATEFALLLPVPEVLGPDDVGVVDPVLLDWINAYSTPREVEYTCDTVFSATQTGFGCGGPIGAGIASAAGCSTPGDMDFQGGASVESSWSEDGYDFVVLSAEESSGLLGWLDTNGFAVPEGGDAILQEYVDAGSFFLAARVSLESVPREGNWLWPIQLRYESEVFSLPIRIGTISSSGVQEVVIYALTDPESGGTVGISNYAQLDVPTECLLPEGTTMSDWYARKLADEHADGGAGWVQEYSWELKPEISGGYHCDPCTAEPVAPGGSFGPFGRNSESAHLTRLRMRYTTEQAVEDIQLYVSGVTGGKEQLKLVRQSDQLEFLFPYCDGGWADEPGTCPDAGLGAASCSVPTSRLPAAALIGALALLRRRRR